MEIEAASPNNEMRKQKANNAWGGVEVGQGQGRARTHKVKSRRKLQREGRQRPTDERRVRANVVQ